MPEYQLAKGIVALSDSKTWDEAKLEWGLENIYHVDGDDPETCLCGHHPILEVCELRNKVNYNMAVVGNCCVKKFMGLPSDKIFQAFRRIGKDINKSVNAETIDHASRKRWISDWERGFYFNIMRKRNLSPKQLNKKLRINEKIKQSLRKSTSASSNRPTI